MAEVNFEGKNMDRRQSPRVSVHLPVQVWGMDATGRPFIDAATIINMSARGIVVQGIRRKMRIGESLEVRMGSRQASFHVVWFRETGEVGMKSITAVPLLPTSVLAHCSQAPANC